MGAICDRCEGSLSGTEDGWYACETCGPGYEARCGTCGEFLLPCEDGDGFYACDCD
jgi:hypothetical protein